MEKLIKVVNINFVEVVNPEGQQLLPPSKKYTDNFVKWFTKDKYTLSVQ